MEETEKGRDGIERNLFGLYCNGIGQRGERPSVQLMTDDSRYGKESSTKRYFGGKVPRFCICLF